MKVVPVLLAAVTLLGFCSCNQKQTIPQYLIDSGYSVLVDHLRHANLMEILTTRGPFTMMAPSNAAFNLSSASKLKHLSPTSAELRRILKFHVVKGYLLTTMIPDGYNVSMVTLSGDNVTVTGMMGFVVIDDVTIFNRDRRDALEKNGVVQEVDRVLIPPPQHGVLNIAHVLAEDDARFQDFYLELMLSDIVPLLNVDGGGDFTVFAPVATALRSFNSSVLNFGPNNSTDVYRELWRNHIVPGRRLANQLTPNASLYTLHGKPLTIGRTTAGLTVNNVHVIETDIVASNGIVHVIDGILEPADLLKHV